MLLRISPRRTLCETADPELILEAVFGSLEVSAYLVTRAEVAQTMAEHAGAAPLDPPDRGCGSFDLGGLVDEIRDTPGEQGLFAFLRTAHRDVVFSSEAEVRAVVERLLEERETRIIKLPKAELVAYVRGRLDAACPEWQLALGRMSASQRRHWRKFAGTAQAQVE